MLMLDLSIVYRLCHQAIFLYVHFNMLLTYLFLLLGPQNSFYCEYKVGG